MQGNQELLKMLYEIDPTQPYGTELFDALARLTVSVAVEAVCLRPEPLNLTADPDGFQTRGVEVYLCRRSMTDTAYPGEWHCPGSVVRPGEEDASVFKRLADREFGSNLESWRFVGKVNHVREERGHFLSLVYLCSLKDNENGRGQWFKTWNLPQKTVASHRHIIINLAEGFFRAENAHIYSSCF